MELMILLKLIGRGGKITKLDPLILNQAKI